MAAEENDHDEHHGPPRQLARPQGRHRPPSTLRAAWLILRRHRDLKPGGAFAKVLTLPTPLGVTSLRSDPRAWIDVLPECVRRPCGRRELCRGGP